MGDIARRNGHAVRKRRSPILKKHFGDGYAIIDLETNTLLSVARMQDDRATGLKQRCQCLGSSGVTLHSYRYAWAERARKCGYPQRFAQEALGHNSKAVHAAYAKKAEVRVPSLDQWEKQLKTKVVEVQFSAASVLEILRRPPPGALSCDSPYNLGRVRSTHGALAQCVEGVARSPSRQPRRSSCPPSLSYGDVKTVTPRLVRRPDRVGAVNERVP